MVAYPRQLCLIYRFCSSVPDFAVSLPSLLSSPTTSLRLANASGTTPCIRDLHPLEKYTCLEHCLTKIICNFEILLLLAAGALCSCRAHTKTICQLGFRCGQQSSQPATAASGFDRKATRNPQLHIVPSVTI